MTRSFSIVLLCFALSLCALHTFANPGAATKPANLITQTGKVLETIDVPGYTYLHLQTEGDTLWVAIPRTDITTGIEVSYIEGIVMKDFHSTSLDRTFESIVFSPGLAQAAQVAEAPAEQQKSSGSTFADAVKNESPQQPTTAPQRSAGSAGATVPYLEIQVKGVEGDTGKTIEEVFSQAETLHGSTIRIRGKVVKFSPNIMGLNWIHIQDGTGDPMNNSHDLVITTSQQAKVDEIILVEGKVSANKDFGFGYKYKVLVEQAVLIH